YVAAMDGEAVKFAESLGDEGEFNLTDGTAPLTARIAARCFLGPDFASAMDQDFFAEVRRFCGGIATFPQGWLPLPKFIRSSRARDRLRAMLGAMIARRRADPLRPPDLPHTIGHLTHCLLESERLHPLADVLARAAVDPIEFDGYTVPAGTFVFASPAVSHRLPTQWPRPDEYWPDMELVDGRQTCQRRLNLS